jgi:lysine-arginine-ornithine-binding protein
MFAAHTRNRKGFSMRMLKELIFASLLVAGAIVAGGQAGAQEKTIKIATEGAYPPFNGKDASGALIGFDVDIAKALCEEMKAKCEIVAQDWDGIIPGLEAKKYDAIAASMSITDERKQKIDFTNPYYSNHLRIVAKKGSGITGPDSLKGKTVGAQRSTLAATYSEDKLGRGSTVKLYDTQTAAYSDLEAGRLDALVSDVYPAFDWLKDKPGFEFVGPKIDVDDKIGIAIRKGDKELADALNKALKTIRDNGTYAKLNAKYFPFDIY